ncbi:MAG: heme exporter protein CcmB [Rhodospirillaceae bacterium]|jgi:heme exporter protein B|nr:heme exporter protein CcmB [Rhodospirillaceae bacterium]
MRISILILQREVRLAFNQLGDNAIIVLFFILAAILFPLGVGPEPKFLADLAPGILWVIALLASLLSFEKLFSSDFEDGSLEQLALTSAPLEIVVLAKAAAHWLTTGIPIMILTPLIAVFYQMPLSGYNILLVSMVLGTPTMSLIGTVGAALTLGSKRGNVLISLLVVPLIIPVLIFGTAAIEAAINNYPTTQHLMLLGAFFLIALVFSPIATASALRHALE